MPPFSVDLDLLQSVINRMGAFDGILDEQLTKLDARIARLHRTWTGDAAVAQQAAHAEWMAGAREMREAMATLRSISTTAHGNYTSAMKTNTAMWEGL